MTDTSCNVLIFFHKRNTILQERSLLTVFDTLLSNDGSCSKVKQNIHDIRKARNNKKHDV